LALVVVTIVVVLASTLNSDFVVTFKRVENQLHSQQAYAFMRGAEGIAREVLLADYNDDKNSVAKDHRSEGLNQRIEYPMPYGIIAGTLCDLQGRYNLNNLSGTASAPKQFTTEQEVFIRLLQVLELDDPLDQAQAEEVTLAVADWIDADNTPRSSGGAEDSYYSNLDLPYKAGNRELQDVSELMWIKGVTAERYEALLPYVVALPAGVPINVNSVASPLLRAINEDGVLQPLSVSEAEAVLRDRDGDLDGDRSNQNEGFDEIADFVTSHPATELNTSRLSVGSDYFLLQIDTYFLERLYKLFAVMNRGADGTIRTIARYSGSMAECPVDGGKN